MFWCKFYIFFVCELFIFFWLILAGDWLNPETGLDPTWTMGWSGDRQRVEVRQFRLRVWEHASVKRECFCVTGVQSHTHRKSVYVPLGGVHFNAVGSMDFPVPRLVSLAFQSSMRSCRDEREDVRNTFKVCVSFSSLSWKCFPGLFQNLFSFFSPSYLSL